ncbi:hypothetical protein R1flu_027336 [Riccia fluitans]|uniref:Uncharacterized protein n=1 Tax=Riccia fluitans TaxID=41844 RepID=A0ABD1XJ80_9MARC
MDGHLVEPLDPDVDATSQKKNTKKQTGSKQPSRKRPRFESNPKDGKEGNLPSAVETSRKGKEKVTESSHLPDVDTNVDIAAEERRTLKIGVNANRLEMDPPLDPHKTNFRMEEEKLKATIEALEKEKREMNARVALMERKDLYKLLEAKMEGF